MNLHTNPDGFLLGGHFFSSMEQLEEACFYDPGLEDEYCEMQEKNTYLARVKEDVDRYYRFAESEYGDGNSSYL